jgi:hypothetical protein
MDSIWTTPWLFRRFRKFAKGGYYLRPVCLPVCLSVRLSAWNNSAPTGRIFMNLLFEYFSKICGEIWSSIKIWQEYQNTRFTFNKEYHPEDGRKRTKHEGCLPHFFMLLYLITIQLLEYIWWLVSHSSSRRWSELNTETNLPFTYLPYKLDILGGDLEVIRTPRPWVCSPVLTEKISVSSFYFTHSQSRK